MDDGFDEFIERGISKETVDKVSASIFSKDPAVYERLREEREYRAKEAKLIKRKGYVCKHIRPNGRRPATFDLGRLDDYYFIALTGKEGEVPIPHGFIHVDTSKQVMMMGIEEYLVENGYEKPKKELSI